MNLTEFKKFCKTLNLQIVDCHLGPAIQLRDRVDYETVLKTMNTEDKVSWAIAEKCSNFDSYLALEEVGPWPRFDAGCEMAKFFVRIMKDEFITHSNDIKWCEDNSRSLLLFSLFLSDKDFFKSIFSFNLDGSHFILIATPEIDGKDEAA